MTYPKWRAQAAAAFLAGLMLVPSQAGWFDKSPAAPVVSDEAVAQIQQAVDDERYLDAGRMLNDALFKAGDDARLLVLAGQVSLYRGRHEEALMTFKRVDADPLVRARALEGQGLALSMLGRSDEALKALQAAVAADTSLWRAWNALGTQYDRLHSWQDADAAYGHALAGSPGNAVVLNNRGFSRLSQNRVEEATTDFVAALEKKPDFTAARNNLRLAIAMNGDYQRSVAGAAKGDRAAVLNNAGFVAMLRGDYAAAKDFFGQAMQAKGAYYAVAAANLESTKGLESAAARHQEAANAAH